MASPQEASFAIHVEEALLPSAPPRLSSEGEACNISFSSSHPINPLQSLAETNQGKPQKQPARCPQGEVSRSFQMSKCGAERNCQYHIGPMHPAASLPISKPEIQIKVLNAQPIEELGLKFGSKLFVPSRSINQGTL